jgi:WD40 repeat protein
MEVEPTPDLVTVVKFRKHALNEQHLLAVAESGGTVNVFNAASPSVSLYEAKDHFFPVNDVQFADTMPWMATCSNDTLLNMHDLNKGQLVRSFIGGHSSFVTKCRINSY